MTKILFKATEFKPIPLKVSKNLPRISMRILINREFIHEKKKMGKTKQNKTEVIYEILDEKGILLILHN